MTELELNEILSTSLYDITGNILDHNTVLCNLGVMRSIVGELLNARTTLKNIENIVNE